MRADHYVWLSLSTLLLHNYGLHADHLESSYVTKPQGCGCLYNVFANMPQLEREKRECSVSCIYSSLSGRCNNLCHTRWGQAIRPFGRLLKPDYCDSNAPDATRCARSGRPLPNARSLSIAFFQDKPENILDKFITSAHMAFGQFLSHDFGRKNEPKSTNEKGINLCGRNQCIRNAVCEPIEVFITDPKFKPSQCLRFQRSTRNDTPDHECKEQQNDVSSYLDFNTVYGGTPEEMKIIRDVRKEFSAYLNMTHFSQLDLGPSVKTGLPLLPQMGKGECKGTDNPKVKCFIAGDKRVMEQPQLTAFHTVFAREHNRLVHGLSKVNPCWSQDRLFFEARKINTGLWQYIVYDEYLPLLLSEENLRYWRLKLQHKGFTNNYDKKINATVSNVFMTGSFRFGHTQIPVEIPLADCRDFRILRRPPFSGNFNNPTMVYFPQTPGVTGIDAVSCGMIAFSAEKSDDKFNEQITAFFDSEKVNVTSRDLESLDITRGRDHALPGYNDWLEFCNFRRAVTFDDFTFIPPHKRRMLSNYYEHVDDVDLFVAGMIETPLAGDLSGPIFSCLNAEQFHRARFGDRFWHEERNNGFTRDQLQNIRQITSGRVFCDNLDDLHSVQPNTLAHPRSVAASLLQAESHWSFDMVYGGKLPGNNERVPCSELPAINLDLWKEEGCWNPKCDSKYPDHK